MKEMLISPGKCMKMLGFRWGNGGNAGNGCLTLLNLGEMVG